MHVLKILLNITLICFFYMHVKAADTKAQRIEVVDSANLFSGVNVEDVLKELFYKNGGIWKVDGEDLVLDHNPTPYQVFEIDGNGDLIVLTTLEIDPFWEIDGDDYKLKA